VTWRNAFLRVHFFFAPRVLVRCARTGEETLFEQSTGVIHL